MDFLTLNFGQLLHIIDNELKNRITNFEKQKKQIISAQYSILFNQTCLNGELYRIYNYIMYIYSRLAETLHTHRWQLYVCYMMYIWYIG